MNSGVNVVDCDQDLGFSFPAADFLHPLPPTPRRPAGRPRCPIPLTEDVEGSVEISSVPELLLSLSQSSDCWSSTSLSPESSGL